MRAWSGLSSRQPSSPSIPGQAGDKEFPAYLGKSNVRHPNVLRDYLYRAVPDLLVEFLPVVLGQQLARDDVVLSHVPFEYRARVYAV